MNNFVSLAVIIVGEIALCFFFRKLSFGKKTIAYCMFILPVLFFNSYMLTEAVTADEGMYIPLFSDLNGVQQGTAYWGKASFQYRVSQIVTMPIIRIITRIFQLDGDAVYMAYKGIHWLFFFLVSLTCLYVWAIYIVKVDKESFNYRLTIIVMAYVLLGLPVCCLILKVCNYDAGSIYFAVLAFSMVVAGDIQNDIRIARFGGMVATISCMEKWVGFGYLVICIALTAYMRMEQSDKGKIKLVVTEVILGFLHSICLCTVSFVLLRIVQKQEMIEMNVGAALFPIIYMMGAFVRQLPYNDMDVSYYDNYVAELLIVGVVLTILLVALLYFFKIVAAKSRKIDIINITIGLFLIVFCVSGITGSYLLHRMVYPFAQIPQDVYSPEEFLLKGVTYFYGAKTKPGHVLASVCFANATLVSNLPSICILFLIISGIVLLLKNKNMKVSYLMQSIMAAMLLVIPLFTLVGQPAVARYFGVSLIILCLCSINIISIFFEEYKFNAKQYIVKILIAFSLALYSLEMIRNLPLFSCFSPIWLVRNESFLNTVRQGEWDAGEAMAWGEELAIAGDYLTKYLKETGGNISETSIVTNYGIKWYSNPGFKIISYDDFMSADKTEYDDTFFVLSKFKLYRSPIPGFIYDVEPIFRVRFNGETTAWIYQGHQIAGYLETR